MRKPRRNPLNVISINNIETYLNTENVARSKDGVEYHPLRPFLPENAKVLFLGSFPPQRKRWCMDFYYPNFINDHWRIEGQLFFGDKNHFVDTAAKRFKLDEIVAFCKERGLAFFDTSTAIRRLQDNASDKFLEVVEPTDTRALIQRLPHLRAIRKPQRPSVPRSASRSFLRSTLLLLFRKQRLPPNKGRAGGGSCSIACPPPHEPTLSVSTRRWRPIASSLTYYKPTC